MATPPINAVGLYTVKAPFTIVSGAVYKCEAIEGFEALDHKGIDIHAIYYAPHGLSAAQYDSDRLNSVDIVTLVSLSAPTIVLPSSFILDYPTGGAIPYSQHFLVVDVGLLPDNFDFTAVEADFKETVQAIVGNDPNITHVVHPVLETIDEGTHEQLTKARAANMAVRDNFKKLYTSEVIKTRGLEQRVDLLTAALKPRV